MVLLLLGSTYSFCARIELKNEVSELWLIDSASSYLETEHGLTIYEVLKRKDEFKLPPKHPHHISDTSKTTWFHFTLIDKRERSRPLVMEFFDFHIDEITLYWQKDNGTVTSSLPTGFAYPFNNREISHKNVSFNLGFVKNDTTEVYLKIKSSKENFISPIIKSYDRFLNYGLAEYTFFGIFYGISIFMILYNLVYFFILREKHYLYYVVYTAGTTVFLMFRNGTGFQFLWPDIPALNTITDHIALNVGITGLLLFSISFLRLKERYPQINKLVWVIIGIQVSAVLVEILLNNFWIDEIVEIIILQVVFALGIFLKKDSEIAFKAYLTAFLILNLSFVITFLESINLINSNPFTVYAIYIGIIAQYFALSLSMAERKRNFLKQRNAVQQDLLRFQKETNQQLEAKVIERTALITEQQEVIASKNKRIMDSMNYAQTIQAAMLPCKKEIKKNHQNFFILNLPRDVVSGDFYWFHPFSEDEFLMILADCTGHGVPGALMSMIGVSAIQDIISRNVKEPSEILDQLHQRILSSLRQNDTKNTDGMDASVLLVNKKKREVLFSGAKSSILVQQDGEIKRLKGSNRSIGGVQYRKKPVFTTEKIRYDSTSKLRILMSTDGYTDQFGGKNDQKYGLRRLTSFIKERDALSLADLEKHIHLETMSWRGSTAQVDDILVMGIDLTKTVKNNRLYF